MVDLFKLAHHPLASDVVDPDMPKNGDAVIVLRSDGSTGMFTLGMDAKRLVEKVASEAELTIEEQNQLDVTQRALALYVAATSPDVMQALIDMVNDPAVSSALNDATPKPN